MPDFGFAYFLVMVVSIVIAYWAEALLPLEKFPADIVHSVRNFSIWTISFLGVDLLLGKQIAQLGTLISQQSFGLLYWLDITEGWLLIILGLLLVDLADYLYHRLAHAVPVLWRLHRVHHTDPTIDVSTALRAHPFPLVVSTCWKLTFVLACGVPPWLLAMRELLLWPLIFIQHANVRLPSRLERALGLVVVTPIIHRIHHSTVYAEHNSNYGEGLVIWDKLLGSYTHPVKERPPIYGLPGTEGSDHQSILGMLASPFYRARRPQTEIVET